nr:PREDICTED: uncharacterized protein LOC106456368 [Pundamilia nyererei]
MAVHKIKINASVPGVLCSKWKVDYQQPHMCVVKGSSVVILCSFSYPDNHIVQEVMWGHKNIFADFNISMTKLKRHESIQEGDSVNLTCTDRCDVGNFSSVFTWFKNGEYLQDGRVLQLRNVSFTNSGNYTCSLKTGIETTSGVRHVDVELYWWTGTRDQIAICTSIAALLIVVTVVAIRSDSWEEHLQHLKVVMAKIQRAGLI